MVTVRTFLAVAAARNWEFHQMDVHNAFLHGDLHEEVYMRMPPGIFLSQRKYALDIISEVRLLGAKPVPFPLEQNHNLALTDGPFLSNPKQYRRLVERLIYLSATRLELSYCVHVLFQFMQQLQERHWEATLRVVRYLKGNPGQGILLRSNCDLQLYAWCNSDWASFLLSRRSLSGWFIMLGKSSISWKIKKQHTVARSSVKAEYRSIATATCELKWLKGLLLALGDEIQNCCIRPAYVSTTIKLTDIFTKALGHREFEYFLCKLGIHNLHAPT
ncbi:PREDICTED: uncharacterized protein LOC109115167 [Nelumbo nucifera]|uniref:Uncharacterized protein LOC109115167 n=1 Tax=Nelumbo nucifera TaxID=4432 RepID=A0A1U8Q8J5_NELNU|nr:PREDICTED: uncharacterized protein LOC109115167 [Nelumbo nucifera]